MIPPLCRWCGKNIAKRTRTVQFGVRPDSLMKPTRWWTPREETPQSLAEAQRLTNEEIVSVRWARKPEYQAERAGTDFIVTAFTWDGSSYVDPFFCTGKHAQLFAVFAVRTGKTFTVDWTNANNAQKQRYAEMSVAP